MTQQPTSNPFQGPAPNMSRSEMRPLVRAQLSQLRDDATAAATRIQDRTSRAHLEDVVARIDAILSGEG